MVRCFLVVLTAALHVFNAEAFVQNGLTSVQNINVWQPDFPTHAYNRRKLEALPLRCTQSPNDGVFGSLFKTLFPSAEERRKEEVRRRRKWMPKPPSQTPEPAKEDCRPAINNYVPPEQSESGKVDIGISTHQINSIIPEKLPIQS